MGRRLFFVTQSHVLSSWQRRSQSWDILVFSSIHGCTSRIATVYFTIFEMVLAGVWYPQIFLPVALTLNRSMLSSTSIFQKIPRRTCIALAVRVVSVILALASIL